MGNSEGSVHGVVCFTRILCGFSQFQYLDFVFIFVIVHHAPLHNKISRHHTGHLPFLKINLIYLNCASDAAPQQHIEAPYRALFYSFFSCASGAVPQQRVSAADYGVPDLF
jgi:hypothetical protein